MADADTSCNSGVTTENSFSESSNNSQTLSIDDDRSSENCDSSTSEENFVRDETSTIENTSTSSYDDLSSDLNIINTPSGTRFVLASEDLVNDSNVSRRTGQRGTNRLGRRSRDNLSLENHIRRVTTSQDGLNSEGEESNQYDADSDKIDNRSNSSSSSESEEDNYFLYYRDPIFRRLL